MVWGTDLRSRRSIVWRISAYLFGYIGGLLVMLWVFQIQLLPIAYQAYKEADVAHQISELGNQISDPMFTRRIIKFAKEETACIRVLRASGTETLSLDFMPYCTLHSMDKQDLMDLWNQALKDGDGTKSEVYAMDTNLMYRQVPSGSQAILHIQVFEPEGKEPFAIFYNSVLTPINGMLSVLQIELGALIVIAVIVAAILVWWISRITVKPITRVVENARRLKEQDYSVTFGGSEFREIAELNEVLNETRYTLEQLDKMRSEIFSKVSHDLRTPLSMIVAYSEAMRDIPGENTPENIQIILDAASHLNELVNNVLVYPRLSDIAIPKLDFSMFDLAEMCQEIVRQHQGLKGNFHGTIVYDGPPHLEVWADKTRMTQVIYNLMNNAISHSVSATVIQIRVKQDGGSVIVSVCDDGQGIPKDEQDLIWELNYTSDRGENHHNGLGLAIVRSILEQHNAQYGVESDLGKGCVFWFRLELHSGIETDQESEA